MYQGVSDWIASPTTRIAVIEAARAQDYVLCAGFDHVILANLHRMRPDWPLEMICGERLAVDQVRAMVGVDTKDGLARTRQSQVSAPSFDSASMGAGRSSLRLPAGKW
jgi:hypothetical protein